MNFLTSDDKVKLYFNLPTLMKNRKKHLNSVGELVLLEWLYFQYQYFIHRLKSLNYLVQRNKQHHRKVLLSSFYINGHIIEFHPETQKFEPPCTV